MHRHKIGFAAYLWAILVVAILIAPILIVVPIGFSSGSLLSYPLPGWSMKWYGNVLQAYPWMFALKNSLIVASVATPLSVVLGVLASYGLTQQGGRLRQFALVFLSAPLIMPTVVTALAMYFFLDYAQLLGSYAGLIIAHTVLALPFVVLTVTATLQGFDRNLVRAGLSLGAGPTATFLQVTLPVILPGVASGAVFAFITSFDEVVVALFISSPSTLTLPRQFFSGLRDQLDPSLIAIASMLIPASVLLLGVASLLRRRSGRYLNEA